MLIAVLEARCGISLSAHDVYLNVAGGLKIAEPAADLAAAAALLSSFSGVALPPERVYFGEISLSGAVRAASHMTARLKEAQKLGFAEGVVPAAGELERPPSGCAYPVSAASRPCGRRAAMRVNAGPVHGKTLATEGELTRHDRPVVLPRRGADCRGVHLGPARDVPRLHPRGASILSWAVAGAAVLYVVLSQKQLAKEMADQIGTQLPVAQIVLGALVFLVVLIIVHLITARASPMRSWTAASASSTVCSGSCSASSAASSSS